MTTTTHPPIQRLTPCQAEEPEIWFAETPAGVEYAKALCQSCPFCLLYTSDAADE